MTDRDDETGRFSETYPKEAFFDAVSNCDIATTSKAAEEIGCSYDLAYRRLNALAEQEALDRHEVGGSFIWEVPSE